jgi:hypothetical protein
MADIHYRIRLDHRLEQSLEEALIALRARDDSRY